MDTARAKLLRQNPTPAEKRLWRLLFPLRTSGYHFRKQAPVGPHVADFACHHARLIIEVDGDTHGSKTGIAHDARRDAFLAGEGYEILRFSNRDVLNSPEGVLTVIAGTLVGRLQNQRAPESASLLGRTT